MAQPSHPTLINLPPPSSTPDTPSEMPYVVPLHPATSPPLCKRSEGLTARQPVVLPPARPPPYLPSRRLRLRMVIAAIYPTATAPLRITPRRQVSMLSEPIASLALLASNAFPPYEPLHILKVATASRRRLRRHQPASRPTSNPTRTLPRPISTPMASLPLPRR
jgi:hypothetical protein